MATYSSIYKVFRGFPGGSLVKNPSANVGDKREVGLIAASERSPADMQMIPPLWQKVKMN